MPSEPGTGGHTDRSSTELLGLPAGARALIVNCDDFGMYEAVNVAVIDAVELGVAASCSLMPPGPAAAHAMALLRRYPHVPVHPGLGDHHARTVDPGWRVRASDHRFLVAPGTRELVHEHGITVVGYHTVRHAWISHRPRQEGLTTYN